MSEKKQIKKIPCQRHSGYYTSIAHDGFAMCEKCKEELNEYIKEKNKESSEYVDKKFGELIKKLEGDTE